MWQFAKAVEGIGAACRALDVPITGGNVSLYNETDGTRDLSDAGHRRRRPARARGSRRDAAGSGVGRCHRAARRRTAASSAAASTSKVVHDLVRGVPPALDLDAERALQALLVDAGGRSGSIRSAHDCSDGGLAVTLAECCFDTGGIGAEHVDRRAATVARDARSNVAAALFGESASRVVVSAAPDELTRGAGAGRCGEGARHA